MTLESLKYAERRAYQVVGFQCLLTCIAAIDAGLVFKSHYTTIFAILAGGSVAIVTTAYFIWQTLARRARMSEKQVVARFYRAEAGKVFASIALLIALFYGVGLPAEPLLLSYLLIQIAASVIFCCVKLWKGKH